MDLPSCQLTFEIITQLVEPSFAAHLSKGKEQRHVKTLKEARALIVAEASGARGVVVASNLPLPVLRAAGLDDAALLGRRRLARWCWPSQHPSDWERRRGTELVASSGPGLVYLPTLSPTSSVSCARPRASLPALPLL